MRRLFTRILTRSPWSAPGRPSPRSLAYSHGGALFDEWDASAQSRLFGILVAVALFFAAAAAAASLDIS
jgi:hypothetical protein